MPISFRVRTFLILLAVGAVIILANRLTAQYFLVQSLQQVALTELLVDVQRCQQQDHKQVSFSHCLRTVNSARAIEPISVYYNVCDASTYANNACLAARQALAQGRVTFDRYAPGDFSLQVGHLSLNNRDWLAAYAVPVTAASSSLVLLEKASVKPLSQEMWTLRDSVTFYTLPVILLSISLAVWLMVSLLMKPVNELRKTMQTLSVDNLEDSVAAPARFFEFQSFVDVFNDLRMRLSRSLSQSRRFAADASHELKTPLTVLRGRTEALVSRLERGSDQQVMALEVINEIDNMSEVVNKLLLLSRADAKALVLDKKPHNISEMLEDFLSDSASYAPDLDVAVRITANVFWNCDLALVRLLVQNLFSNAVKYNQPKGWIQVTLACASKRCVLTLENAANGVPMGLADKAFARFYRLDDARASAQQGHGLGLSICREIADVHQAELDMKVQVDRVVLVLSFDADVSHGRV